MTACILCGMDLWRDCRCLGWCCSRPSVQFSCQIHFEPVVFFWLPFLNGLSYRVLVALDCKIIQCRLRISHNKISFIEIMSSYGWICLATNRMEIWVPFFCQIHFEPVVFFWLPFLNCLSYRVLVALDCKIIRCRLKISHNKISFIEILSSYGWICLARYLFPR